MRANNMKKTVLITGGAGFIGKQLIYHLRNKTNHRLINIDKLTYASSLPDLVQNEDYVFIKLDICDADKLRDCFELYQPDVVMHLAAESHVDNSISGPAIFIQSNLVGTFTLLEQSRQYWQQLPAEKRDTFRFLHVSTDEVYGDLGKDDPAFTEQTPYAPSSPYSASKAGSDHLVRAWHKTYGLPVLITNCSNNYGPGQFPEKLIPLMIYKAKTGQKLPVYGDGTQIRDWLYVEDHVEALWNVAQYGKVGETYNIGGMNEMQNIDVVRIICQLMEELCDKPPGINAYESLITFVKDRPGHDQRYAIDCSKIAGELNWQPKQDFHSGMRKTVEWYLSYFSSKKVAAS